MYKERSSNGGDGFLLGSGENKASRITARVANRTALQNMILASIVTSSIQAFQVSMGHFELGYLFPFNKLSIVV